METQSHRVIDLIFFHGGGSQEDYDADAKLVASLRRELGTGYRVHYPLLPNTGTPDLGRRAQINHHISSLRDEIILVGHSLGASMLLAHLSENGINKNVKGLFLLATPFWEGTEDWVRAFELRSDFAQRIDQNIPMYFYHCRDDEEVPFDQFNIYQQQLPWATFREIPTGGHQLNNDLAVVATDIRSI